MLLPALCICLLNSASASPASWSKDSVGAEDTVLGSLAWSEGGTYLAALVGVKDGDRVKGVFGERALLPLPRRIAVFDISGHKLKTLPYHRGHSDRKLWWFGNTHIVYRLAKGKGTDFNLIDI